MNDRVNIVRPKCACFRYLPMHIQDNYMYTKVLHGTLVGLVLSNVCYDIIYIFGSWYIRGDQVQSASSYLILRNN